MPRRKNRDIFADDGGADIRTGTAIVLPGDTAPVSWESPDAAIRRQRLEQRERVLAFVAAAAHDHPGNDESHAHRGAVMLLAGGNGDSTTMLESMFGIVPTPPPSTRPATSMTRVYVEDDDLLAHLRDDDTMLLLCEQADKPATARHHPEQTRGTATRDEIEKADALPLCARCAVLSAPGSTVGL